MLTKLGQTPCAPLPRVRPVWKGCRDAITVQRRGSGAVAIPVLVLRTDTYLLRSLPAVSVRKHRYRAPVRSVPLGPQCHSKLGFHSGRTGSRIGMAMTDCMVRTANHRFSLFRELRTVTGDPYSAHNCSGPRTQTEIPLSIATEAVPSGLARGGDAKTLD